MEVQAEHSNPRLFRVLSVTLHAVGAVHFWYGCYYDWFHVIVPPQVLPIFSAYGYKLKFLTYWDAILQAVYFSVCVVNDVAGSYDKVTKERTKLCKVKEFMMAAFAFPLAMFVGVTFWGLMAVDRELVLPRVLDAYFPSWLNHVMHTNIIVFQLLEMATSSRKYPKRKYGLSALFLFQATYLSWMHVVYYKSGLWVYPIFNVLNIPQRMLFFVGSFATGYVFYYIGEKLNRLLWGESRIHRSEFAPQFESRRMRLL
ncbi:hypothetical protein AAG570_005858 [Ranatra chinensis]|uniref:Uncharacterized protein n=1 Tax=Ranatra chinensis TaxID=642074 RepID=A0ABD0XWN6_9HEMI